MIVKNVWLISIINALVKLLSRIFTQAFKIMDAQVT